MIWQKNQNPITKTRPANVLGVLSGPESEVNYSTMDGQQQKYAKLPHNNCNHEKHNIMKMQIEACKENSYIILYSYMYETDLNLKKSRPTYRIL